MTKPANESVMRLLRLRAASPFLIGVSVLFGLLGVCLLGACAHTEPPNSPKSDPRINAENLLIMTRTSGDTKIPALKSGRHGFAHLPQGRRTRESLDEPLYSDQEILKARDVSTDIGYLIYALENAYGGHALVSKDDFALSIFALKSLMRQRSGWTRLAFCERVDAALNTLPDEQLMATFNRRACANERRERSQRLGQVGSNMTPRGLIPWSLSKTEIASKNVPVIALTYLPAAEAPAWNGFIEQVRSILQTAPALVLDVRGNVGGDATYAQKLVALLLGNENLAPSAIQKIVERQHPASLALRANQTWLELNQWRIQGRSAPESLKDQLRQTLKRYDVANSGREPLEKVVTSDTALIWNPEKGFAGPIRILMDHSCRGSCEAMLVSLEKHPNIQFVGEPTAGVLHFDETGTLLLPRSGIEVLIPTQIKILVDDRFIERSGLVPHVPVSAHQDAFEAARRDLSTLFSKQRR